MTETAGVETATPTNQLAISTQTVHKVDSYRLEQFVNEVYAPQGVTDYSFQADQLAGNDTTHEFNVENDPNDADSYDYFREWLESGGTTEYATNEVLNDLCRRGLIPAGTYLVDLSY